MGIITLRKSYKNIVVFCLTLIAIASGYGQCPTVTNHNQSFCDTQNPTIASLVATNNGGGVRWYAAVNTPAANFLPNSTALVDGEDYYADDNTGTCGARQMVVVTVFTKPSVIAQQQGFCEESTVSDLQATGNNIQWYTSATGGTALSPSTILINNTFYWASQTNPNTGCETSRQRVFVTIRILPTPTGDPIQQFCSVPPPTVANLVANVTANLIWYPSPTSGVELSPSTPLINGQSYYAADSDDFCESIQRLEVTAIFNDPNNAGTSGTRRICVASLPTLPPFNLFDSLGGTPNTTGTWTGPVPTSNGNLGTINPASLTLAGSPYTFTYTVSSSICAPASATVTVIILPQPTVAISANTTICSGGTATVTFTGTPNATVTYTVNGGANQNTVLNASGTATITNTYTATTIYTLVSAASAGTPSCSQPFTNSITITVLPLPTASITANPTTICSGNVATITFTGTPNATVTYTVNGGGNQQILLNSTGSATITGTFTATTTYTLISIVTAGTPACTRTLTGSVVVTVIPLPSVAISSSTSVCPNGSATVTFTGTPNATVTYNVNGGISQNILLNAGGTATITTSYTITTTYNLVSIASAGTPSCTRPQTGSVTITVLPLPVVTIAANTTICSGSSATVTFTGTPNATVIYTVNGGGNQTINLNGTGTAAISATYTATTTYTLVSVASAGTPSCVQPQTASITITVIPQPTVVISGSTTICPNAPATVTFTGTPNATVTFNINGGASQTILLNAAGTATITNTFTATTTFNLISIATAGTPSCINPQTGSVVITVLPLPVVTVAANAAICSGNTATVTFTGTPNATVTYTVNGGGNQTIILNAAGTATITNAYTVTTVFALVSVTSAGTPGCSQLQSGSATISVTPLPTVSISSSTTICSGGSATVTFIGTPGATVTYTVNGGVNQTISLNTSGTATITNIYTATTTYSLVSVATSGTPPCIQPQAGTITITVLPLPIVSITANMTICSGDNATVTFTGTPNAIVTYSVNGGSAQTIILSATGTATVTNTYTATTIFTLVSIASSGIPGCSQPQSGTATITVIPPPVATISADAAVCPNGLATVTFTGTPNAIVAYSTNGGANQTIVLNGSGLATITNNYTVTTVFNLLSVATSGNPACSQPQTGTVTITVLPLPVVAISSNSTICSGGNATVTFVGTPNAIVTYSVNGSPNQTVALDNAGNATITAAYTSTTIFTLVSAATSGSPGCSQPQAGTVTITVNPLPVVTISANASVCPNGSATITFNGTPNATVTYTVDGGANQTIALDNSGVATIINTYTATTVYALVSVSSAGSPSCLQPQSGTATITVVPLPIAVISSDTTICSGSSATITFSGTPNAIVTYTINNGINQNISLNNSGIGILAGTFTATTVYTLVSVAVSGTPACAQPLGSSITITVTQPPVAGNNAAFSLCANATPQDLFLLLGPTAQAGGVWSPALASGSGIFNPAVDPSGTYMYTVTGTAPCPNAVATVTVNVVTPANAGTDAVANFCSNIDPQNLFLLLGGNPQVGGSWSPTLSSGTGIFTLGTDQAGIYTYTVVGTPPCSNDTATVTITITPGPDAGISGTAAFCTDSAPQDLFLSLGGTPQVGGTWSPALASGTGVFDPAVDSAGVYTYTFSGNQPCDDDTATVTVTINPVPDAGTDGTAFFCSNYPATDLFLSLGGTPQPGGTWSPALASGSGIFDPLLDAQGVYTYTVGGVLCSTDMATVTVTVVQSPNAGGAGATLLINSCTNITSVDLATGLNGTQGAGTWTDDDATGALSGNFFNPQQAGEGTYHFTYTVTGGVTPCVSDSVQVTVIVSPVPDAGTFSGVQNICISVGSVDLFSLLSGNQAGGDFTDSNNLTVNNPIDISAFPAGTYSYTYTVTNPCGTDAETVQFTVEPIPVLTLANISASTPVCLNSDATVTLSGMADGNYIITYNLSGSNILNNETVNVAVSAGSGSFTIAAADIQNPGLTTITFINIANATTTCAAILADVTFDFTVRPVSNLDDANLNIANVCLGGNATVIITNATGLADGSYQFNYNIPQAIPSTGGTGSVAISGGSGQFSIPSSALNAAGKYTLTINTITGLSTGCNNQNENATAAFQVFPIPDVSGSVVTAASGCANFSNQVTIIGAASLADGTYTITYTLSGADISAGTASVPFVGGAGNFSIPASQLANAGSVTITINQLVSGNSSCGASGTNFNPVTFTVTQLETPELVAEGNEFCATENPTIADLSANINSSEPVIWYNSSQNGTAYSETDLLVAGTTYYAAFSAGGCESGIRLEVTVDLSKCGVIIPDGFSPNNDNINDFFAIKNLIDLYPNFKLEIYNRYGSIVYKGNKNTPDWDGTSSEGGIKLGDNTVPAGVYFYILEFNDGIRKPKQGRLYLSR